MSSARMITMLGFFTWAWVGAVAIKSAASHSARDEPAEAETWVLVVFINLEAGIIAERLLPVQLVNCIEGFLFIVQMRNRVSEETPLRKPSVPLR